jgi:hypothetical protein
MFPCTADVRKSVDNWKQCTKFYVSDLESFFKVQDKTLTGADNSRCQGLLSCWVAQESRHWCSMK